MNQTSISQCKHFAEFSQREGIYLHHSKPPSKISTLTSGTPQ